MHMALLRHNVKSFIDSIKESIFGDKEKSDALKDAELEVLEKLIHYPMQPKHIPLISANTLMSQQSAKISLIRRNIGLASDTGVKFNSKVLVDEVIRNLIGYIHLLPASEMDHHHHIGGLLEHSLDVSSRALRFAMTSMLDDTNMIDEDVFRRPRYEYAAWVCGLIHDAGKVISNVMVLAPNNGEVWKPLTENIYDWAQRQQTENYVITHRKERRHNEHESNASIFLSLVLNNTARDYLTECSDDIYGLMVQTLVGYSGNAGFLSNAVRRADSASTYEDYARTWKGDTVRAKSTVAAVIDVIRSLYQSWTVNQQTAQVFIFGTDVYLTQKAIDETITKCQEIGISVPVTSKTLITILVDKRILSTMSDKNLWGMLFPGEFSVQDVAEYQQDESGVIRQTSPVPVLLTEWSNFVIGDEPMPDSIHGALRYSTGTHKHVMKLVNRNGVQVITPQNKASQPEVAANPQENAPESNAMRRTPALAVVSAVESPESAESDTAPISSGDREQPAQKDATQQVASLQQAVPSEQASTTPQTASTKRKRATKAKKDNATANNTPAADNAAAKPTKQDAAATTKDTPPKKVQKSSKYPWRRARMKETFIDVALAKWFGELTDGATYSLTDIGIHKDHAYISLNKMIELTGQPKFEVLNELRLGEYIEPTTAGGKTYWLSIKVNDESVTALYPSELFKDFIIEHIPNWKCLGVQPANTNAEDAKQLVATTKVAPAKATPQSPKTSKKKPATKTPNPSKDNPERTNVVASETPQAPVAEGKTQDAQPKRTRTKKAQSAKANAATANELAQSKPAAPRSEPQQTEMTLDEAAPHEQVFAYKDLISQLVSESEVKPESVRNTLKAMKVNPKVGAGGKLTITLTDYQFEELRWKLTND